MPPPIRFSEQSRRTEDSPISYFMQQAVENPDLISLAAGLVDQASLPASEIADVVAELASQPDQLKTALQYGTTEGFAAFRSAVLEHACKADGVEPSELSLSPDDVVVTGGSQQLLYLVSEALLDPGDIVLTESPSYFVYHGLLKSMGVRVQSVPMDGEGMITEALEAKLEHHRRKGQLDRVKLIYTVDYFQNPTGLSLSERRREHLVELARQYGQDHRLLVLEDAAYRELRYEGPDLPSVKRFDPTNEQVITTYTFSKPCAPGLKTGYGLLPTPVARAVSQLKGNHDFGSCNFAQHLIHRMLTSGAYHSHLKELQAIYRSKRDVMVAALEESFGDVDGVSWTKPAGGLYVWAKFPDDVGTGPNSEFTRAALDAGVLYVPGEFGHASEGGQVPSHEMRLTFGCVSEAEITEGIARLRRAYDAVARTPAMAGAN